MWLRSLVLGGIGVLAGASAHAFDFADLRSMVEERGIRSIEDLIPALPGSLRYRYAVVFSSRSLQGASFTSPRIVMYGEDARLVITFNGESGQRGYRAVETMEFNDSDRAFRFREIEFPERAEDARPVVFSEPNPDRCRLCHGTPARPIWDTFPSWPGAYGERYHAALSPEERAGLQSFLARQAEHPRYRHLLGAARFADPEFFRPGSATRYGGTAGEPPNAELSALLGALAFRSIARALGERPDFETYAYALLGASERGCGSLRDFYPNAQSQTVARAFDSFATHTSVANQRQARSKRNRLNRTNQSQATVAKIDDANAATMVRFLAETLLSESTRNWTLALEKDTYDFTMPPSATESLQHALLEEIGKRDPAILELNSYSTVSDSDRYCSYLRRRSHGALAGAEVGTVPIAASHRGSEVADRELSVGRTRAPDPTGASYRPAALNLCISCHQSGAAPGIPFSDEALLAHELAFKPARRGSLVDEVLFRLSPEAGSLRMPLGINLPDADRADLERYFRRLAPPTASQRAAPPE